jgi:hypothetical protein
MNDLDEVKKYIEDKKDLFLKELKNKIDDICKKHDIIFDSGMGGYSFKYFNEFHYYFEDYCYYFLDNYSSKDIHKQEEDLFFDLNNSEDEDEILYFKEEIRKIQKIKEFHPDVIELEKFAAELEKVFKFGSNPITWVPIK